MNSQKLAELVIRGTCFLAAALFIGWPFLAQGRVPIFSLVIAMPFVLAGAFPYRAGPLIGKALMFVATLGAFYDPPSSIGFFPDRLALALPFFVLALMLSVPALPHALARLAVRD